ncbi:MAG: hypothetical protein ACR2MD_04155 [Aridibacter sp.]
MHGFIFKKIFKKVFVKVEETIKKLESYWNIDDGLFYELRYKGILDIEKSEKFVQLLESIEISGEQINRRLVSLLWYLPLFLTWQKERISEQGGEIGEIEDWTNEIISILEKKLGVP